MDARPCLAVAVGILLFTNGAQGAPHTVICRAVAGHHCEAKGCNKDNAYETEYLVDFDKKTVRQVRTRAPNSKYPQLRKWSSSPATYTIVGVHTTPEFSVVAVSLGGNIATITELIGETSYLHANLNYSGKRPRVFVMVGTCIGLKKPTDR